MTPCVAYVREKVAEVSSETGIGAKDIESPAKFRHMVKARREVWKRLYAEGYSLKGIGRAWGCAHQIIRVGVRA